MNPLQFNNLKYAHIPHGITTRATGASPPPYHSLNLGLNTGDNTKNVTRNRSAISTYFSVEPDKMYLPRQVHGSNVSIVVDQSTEKVSSTPADALVTQQRGCLLGVLVADCYPVLASDRAGRIVAAMHAGRLGIQNGILQNTISTMRLCAGIDPKDILIGIGPGICQDHYPVDRKTAEAFIHQTNMFYSHHIDDSALDIKLDLRSTIHAILIHQGIPASQIEHLHFCTYENPVLFFSHRLSKTQTGRFGAFIRRPEHEI